MSTVFRDDFESYPVGSGIPEHYSRRFAISNTGDPITVTWDIATASYLSGKVLKATSSNDNEEMLSIDTYTGIDAVISFDAALINGENCQPSFDIRYKDPDNRVHVRLDRFSGNFSIYERYGGVTQITRTPTAFALGQKYTVTIRCIGRSVTAECHAGGALVATVSQTLLGINEGYFGPRYIGDAGATMKFDNVAIQATGEDRVRSSLQEDAGSILESTEAIPSEVSASIAYDGLVTLERGALEAYRRSLTPTRTSFIGYPQAVPNTERLSTYIFETKIGRMARTFPPKLWERVDKISALASHLRNGDGTLDPTGDRVTAQAALQYIFDQWTATYDWFSAELVPDLRTWWPSEDYSGTHGVVYVLAIRIRQERNRRQSMLDILREYLSPFSVTPRQNSAGNIELVPQHGPDADATPVITLTEKDIVWPGLSDGGADTRFAKNLINVTNQGDVRSPDVQVMEPAWLQIASNENLGHADVLFTPPASVRNLNPGTDADGNPDELTTAAHGLTANVDPFCAQKCSWFWAVGADSIPAGDEGILLTSSSGTKQITAEAIAGNGNGGVRYSEAVPPSGVTVNTIPYSGETVDAIRVEHDGAFGLWRARWDEVRQGVVLWWADGRLETTTFFSPHTWTFGVNLQDASVGITEGPVQSATVGTVTDGESEEFIPGTDGGNAIVQSQDANGVNEASIDIRVYTLEPTALADIGLGYLRDNIDPRVIRAGDQSPYRAFPIDFDHIGHRVQLPDGSEAILLSVGDVDDFSPGHGSPVLRSSVRFLVVTDPVVDTTTTFLHFADGSYFELADGTISEEA